MMWLKKITHLTVSDNDCYTPASTIFKA